mgnify:CR=1 FL=1
MNAEQLSAARNGGGDQHIESRQRDKNARNPEKQLHGNQARNRKRTGVESRALPLLAAVACLRIARAPRSALGAECAGVGEGLATDVAGELGRVGVILRHRARLIPQRLCCARGNTKHAKSRRES